ncbi:reverse transcriptase domain-containing protein [Tanacetum coccineum]
MEDEFKPSVQPQRHVNPNIKEVVPKKRGMIAVKNVRKMSSSHKGRSLDGAYFQIPIALEDQEKTTFTCPYRAFTYKRMPFGLCNAPATFQGCMTDIFHELIKDSMEVFMDNFSVFGNSFDHCLKNLKKMLKRCQDTNLVLNWEKCHFMVKEGIVLGHKVSGAGNEVDKAKIEAVSKLPYLTNVKAIRSLLGHAGFYRRLKRKLTQAPIMIKPDWSLPFEVMCDASDYAVRAVLWQRIDKHFKPIHYASKTMNEAQENYTTTEKELLAVVFAFDKWILLLQEFDIRIHDKKGAENLAADHLSRLENPDLGKLTKAEIRDLFPKERLMTVSDNNNEPWMNHSFSSSVLTESCEGASPEMRQHKSFGNVIVDHLEDIMVSSLLQEKSLKLVSTGHIYSATHAGWSKFAMHVNEPITSPQGMKHKYIQVCEIFDV